MCWKVNFASFSENTDGLGATFEMSWRCLGGCDRRVRSVSFASTATMQSPPCHLHFTCTNAATDAIQKSDCPRPQSRTAGKGRITVLEKSLTWGPILGDTTGRAHTRVFIRV